MYRLSQSPGLTECKYDKVNDKSDLHSEQSMVWDIPSRHFYQKYLLKEWSITEKDFSHLRIFAQVSNVAYEPLVELSYQFSLYFSLAFLGKELVSSLNFEIYFPKNICAKFTQTWRWGSWDLVESVSVQANGKTDGKKGTEKMW